MFSFQIHDSTRPCKVHIDSLGLYNGKYKCSVSVELEWCAMEILCNISHYEIECLKQSLNAMLKEGYMMAQKTVFSLGDGSLSGDLTLYTTGTVIWNMDVKGANKNCSLTLKSDMISLSNCINQCDEWIKADNQSEIPYASTVNQHLSTYSLSLHKMKDYGDYSGLIIEILNENLQVNRQIKVWNSEIKELSSNMERLFSLSTSFEFCPLGEFVNLAFSKVDKKQYLIEGKISCYLHEMSETLHFKGVLGNLKF